jgi:hypothetical protein
LLRVKSVCVGQSSVLPFEAWPTGGVGHDVTVDVWNRSNEDLYVSVRVVGRVVRLGAR